MRVLRTVMMTGAALVVSSASVQAQCGTTTADACQKTKDIFNFLTPQISTALAGGSTTLGQGGVLGGFPHWTIALHANAVQGSFPTVDNVAFSTTGAKASSYVGKDQLIPMASIDGAVGIYEGFNLGVTKVGGVDLLIAATYLPKPGDSNSGETQITLPGGSTKIGYGVRLGLLQESILVPGVSFSYIKRDLPTISISGTSNTSTSVGSAPGSFSISNLALKTSSWRFSAAKTFLIFGLEGGFGQDTYDNSAGVNVTVNAAAPVGTQTANTVVSNSMKRSNVYAGLSINFFIGKLVGEIGQVSGGSLPSALNTFGEDPAKGRSYFSVGLRTGF